MKSKIGICTLVALFNLSSCFKAESHLLGKNILNEQIVARMAYDILNTDYPDVLASATALLKVFTDANPGNITKESDYPFVECATYADDIRYTTGSWQANWHFVNYPFFSDGGSPTEYPNWG